MTAGHPGDRVPFPVTFTALESAVAAAYRATTFPDDVARVKQWVGAAVNLNAANGAQDVVAAVARVIRDTIAYRRRDARGVQTPGETLAAGTGSCRDMATLMLEALRALGLPARFASGYLDCAASEAGRATTHAWAEAYLPEIGWTGYDPTLGEPTSGGHVVAGVSNDPRGVMPITGTFFGQQDEYLGMTVVVQTERFVHAPNPKPAEPGEAKSDRGYFGEPHPHASRRPQPSSDSR